MHLAAHRAGKVVHTYRNNAQVTPPPPDQLLKFCCSATSMPPNHTDMPPNHTDSHNVFGQPTARSVQRRPPFSGRERTGTILLLLWSLDILRNRSKGVPCTVSFTVHARHTERRNPLFSGYASSRASHNTRRAVNSSTARQLTTPAAATSHAASGGQHSTAYKDPPQSTQNAG